jgi:hypothetical protein
MAALCGFTSNLMNFWRQGTQRIVYSYEMYSDESLISISVASNQILEAADATTLVWTEHGAFLDGLDTSDLREGGTSWLLDNMGGLGPKDP